jgi:hypothetical protein
MTTIDALLWAIELIERSGVKEHDPQAEEVIKKLEELIARG